MIIVGRQNIFTERLRNAKLYNIYVTYYKKRICEYCNYCSQFSFRYLVSAAGTKGKNWCSCLMVGVCGKQSWLFSRCLSHIKRYNTSVVFKKQNYTASLYWGFIDSAGLYQFRSRLRPSLNVDYLNTEHSEQYLKSIILVLIGTFIFDIFVIKSLFR